MQVAAYCLMLESYTLHDLGSEHPWFVIINYEQDHRKITSLYQWFITVFYKSKIKAISPFKRLLCRISEKNSEPSQTFKMKHLERIVKKFKDRHCFCDKFHLRFLGLFEYTSEEYLFWKYPEN